MNKLNLLSLTLLACAAVMLSADSARAVLCYPDADGDSFGDAGAAGTEETGCAPGFIDNNLDCNDEDPAIHPGAQEVCNGFDDDCDGLADEDAVDAQTWYLDVDQDGYGTAIAVQACSPPPGYASVGGDCDDGDGAIHPGATEVCNGVDDDCDGLADEDAVDAQEWHQDLDGDGFGDPATVDYACQPPTGSVADATDCDDSDPAINPGAAEVCNGADDNCNGTIDEGCGACLVALTGDVNLSGTLTSADVIGIVNFCFKGGAVPQPCAAAGDVNCTGAVTSADIIAMVNHVFKGGSPPCDVCTLIPGTWSCP